MCDNNHDKNIVLWNNDFTMVNQEGANLGVIEDFIMVDSNSRTLSPELDLSHELANIDSSPSSSRLGLRLPKTPSLVSLLERCLNRSGNHEGSSASTSMNHNNLGSSSHEKLKASNFPALHLQIGDWQRTSKNEGDLVAKLYYAKRKMVWELLNGSLKSKIEMQWNDIVGIRILTAENEMRALEIELDKPPMYFKETNPQPRKHTLWESTSDFTNGQAPTWRRHCARFAPGILDKHIEKLLQYDQRLFELSHKPFPSQLSPYFESNVPRPSDMSLDFNGYGSGPRSEYFPGSPHPYPAYSTTTRSVTPHLSDMNHQGRNYNQSMTHQNQIVWDQQLVNFPDHVKNYNIVHDHQGPSINGGSHDHQNHWFGHQYCSQLGVCNGDHEMNTMNRLLESLDVNTMNNTNNHSTMSTYRNYQQYTNGDYQQARVMQNGGHNNNNGYINSNGLPSDHDHVNWLLPPPQQSNGIRPVMQVPPVVNNNSLTQFQLPRDNSNNGYFDRFGP